MPDLSLDEMLLRFGKQHFRPMQRDLMECALRGQSCIGILPTGSGKSLCYQIPAVMMPGVTVVVSPLIALMRDQVDALQSMDVAAARYDSSLTDEEKDALLAELTAGQVKILYVAPESLESVWMKNALTHITPGLFVVDEAHCLSQWGHSFRPDYLALPAYFKKYGFRSVMALTATAPERVCLDLARHFGVSEESVFRMPPYRENILRMVETLPEEDKTQRLCEFLSDAAHRPAVVYVRARKDAEILCFSLGQAGFAAKAYHAGMPPETRAQVQDDFLYDRVDVLVATIAFGMGIDKPNVRTVAHYHPPTGAEAYVQESGRAGRDGEASFSLVLLSGADLVNVENRMRAAMPDKEAIRGFLTALERQGAYVTSMYEASTLHDLPEVVRDRILFELKRRRLVTETAQGHKYYKVKPLFPLKEILYGRNKDETAHLKWLDANREGETIDIALNCGITWAEVGALLDELGLSGEWKVERRQLARELQSAGFSAHELAAELTQYYEQSLSNDLERWQTCLDALLAGECLNRWLDRYFGFNQPAAPCGHCPYCLNKVPPRVKTPQVEEIPPHLRAGLMELAAERRPALTRPAQLARFLLGVSTPASMRARLWSHPLYGALSDRTWQEVSTEVKALF